MKERFYSNWVSVLLAIGSWIFIFAIAYAKFGFSKNVQIGSLMAIACTLWLIWERYTTYIEVEDNRWLINAEQRLFPDIKIDIASILYIARVPHFIFRSWGGRLVIFFRDDSGRVRQTGIPETMYTWDSLAAIVKRLAAIKPTIELDLPYQRLILKKDPFDADLSSELPRSIKEMRRTLRQSMVHPKSRASTVTTGSNTTTTKFIFGGGN